MKIIAKCPGCGIGWELPEGAVDCRVRCSRCGVLFKVPELEQMSEAVDKVNKSKGGIFVDGSGRTYG